MPFRDKLISDIANKVTAVIFSIIFPTLLFLSTIIQIFGIIILFVVLFGRKKKGNSGSGGGSSGCGSSCGGCGGGCGG